MNKPRLRLTSRGWSKFMFSMLTGTKDFRTGVIIPDQYGCTRRDIWVGPFPTAEQAFRA